MEESHPQSVDVSASTNSLTEKDWGKLIRDIHNGRVIPVVGPELVTIAGPDGSAPVSLARHLAPLLARRLGLLEPERFVTVNAVVCAHLVSGGRRRDTYDEIREILDELREEPSPELRSLARIRDFDFFIASTFDRQLARALERERPGFEPERHVVRFHPSTPVDVPEPLGTTHLFHILGDYDTFPDFALWEEDHMEYVCGLLECRDTLEKLFRLLKSRYLLLLGAPSSDWIVRFLLRVTRQERLSDRGDSATGEYLADRLGNLEAPLVFFFDKLIDASRVIDGCPLAFVRELGRRWNERHGEAGSDEDFLTRLPDTMPKDAVFISYASEDLKAALAIARGLHAGGVPVWIDKARLRAGADYEAGLEAAVRVHCSFFLSLISDGSEADTERSRYVHKERDWAAARHVDGYVFYVPVSIRAEEALITSEPACFTKIQCHSLPCGTPTPAFVRHLRHLVEAYRSSGRPRG